jgi:predicted DNA-binding protein (MmcQ/YjbR family)
MGASSITRTILDSFNISAIKNHYQHACKEKGRVKLVILLKCSDMDHKTVEDYILSMSNAVREYPFGTEVAVYKTAAGEAGKMFALIAEGSDPVRLSLKCDPQLSVLLREKYETVMPGYHLNKKHWNTIVLTGQLEWSEVQDLIRHSYLLVTGA